MCAVPAIEGIVFEQILLFLQSAELNADVYLGRLIIWRIFDSKINVAY